MNNSPLSPSTSVSDLPIRCGIASFGLSGQVFHAPFLELHPAFELCAVVERSAKRAQALYPRVQSLDSFEQLLEQDLELIVVNTPDPTHYDYVRRALLAGKHVVVEKPFVTSESEARELVALAQQLGRMLMVYQNRRFDGDFLTLAQLIRSGVLGRVVELESSFPRYRPELASTGKLWRELPQGRSGITYDLCSHLCDQAVALFGKPNGVWATLAYQREGTQVDDYCRMVLIYDDLRVSLRAGKLMREPSARFALHGTQGSYVKFGFDPQEEALRHGGLRPDAPHFGEESEADWGVLHTDAGRVPYPTLRGEYMRFYEGVYGHLRLGEPQIVSHEEMILDMQILEAAFESHSSGRVVSL